MKKILSYILFSILFFSITANIYARETSPRLVMYYGDWSPFSAQGYFTPFDMPVHMYTHLLYSFVAFDEYGNITLTDNEAGLDLVFDESENGQFAGILTAFQILRQDNPNLRIGISLGGWTHSGYFPVVAADDERRENLISQVLALMEFTNMDFVDVDWEYPGHVRWPDLVDNVNDQGHLLGTPEDEENFTTLLREFRAALDSQGERLGKTYELTIAVGSQPNHIEFIDIPTVSEIVDFINIMTYDMAGAWNNFSSHATNLFSDPEHERGALSIDASVQMFLDLGVSPEQLLVGAAFYSRGWGAIEQGSYPDPERPGLFGNAMPIEGTRTMWHGGLEVGAINDIPVVEGDQGWHGGIWAARNIERLQEELGVREFWDNYAKASYFYNPQTGAFFTIDTPRSLEYKSNFILSENLGGMLVWMASHDAYSETGRRDLLTSVIYENLFVDGIPTNNNNFNFDTDNLSFEQVSTSMGNRVIITNNATLTHTNEVLRTLEERYNSLQNPQIILRDTAGNVLLDLELPTLLPGENITFYIPNRIVINGTLEINSRFSTERDAFASSIFRVVRGNILNTDI
ncbi:MAG: glycoside hydrolase family 18 protein [Defluviitaleaceae bacterium]|nr:glycoside hydrolase family 18 protein [Defluviitaleaceae bacterium]